MGQHFSKPNRPRTAKALCRPVVGFIASVGAFFAFGMTPLASAPSANADPLTDLIDVLIEPAIAASSGISPAEFLDPSVLDTALSELATPAGWDTVLTDLSSVSAFPDAGAAATTSDPSNTFVQALEQDWMNSPLGQQVDGSLNAWFAHADPAAP